MGSSRGRGTRPSPTIKLIPKQLSPKCIFAATRVKPGKDLGRREWADAEAYLDYSRIVENAKVLQQLQIPVEAYECPTKRFLFLVNGQIL